VLSAQHETAWSRTDIPTFCKKWTASYFTRHSFTLKIEKVGASKTSVHFHQFIRCHIAEDTNLHIYRIYAFGLQCRAMNEAVRFLYFFAELEFIPRPYSVGVVIGEVVLGQVFLRVLRLSPSRIISWQLHFHRCWVATDSTVTRETALLSPVWDNLRVQTWHKCEFRI
jgi:hypothetical protein